MNISLKNSPIIEDWMTEEEKTFRSDASKYINEVIKQEKDLFPTEDIGVNFFQEGVSSVVALLSFETQKYVLKTSIKKEKARIEAFVFKKWGEIGIDTPKVYSVDYVNDHSYVVMEYLSQPVLDRSEDFSNDLAILFNKIHAVKVEGFGGLKIDEEGRLVGQYNNLSDAYWSWFEDRESLENVADIEEALGILQNEVPTIGHFDFGHHHIFATQPITIFDPDPEALPRVVDIASFIAPTLNEEDKIFARKKEILSLYNQISEIDFDKLVAGLVLWSNKKAFRLRRRPDELRLKRVRFLLENIGTIDRASNYLNKCMDS